MSTQQWEQSVMPGPPSLTTIEAIDERLRNISQSGSDFRTEIMRKLEKIENDITGGYVRREEFIPVRNAVYGFIGIVVSLVVTALVYLLIKGGPI